MSSIDCMNPHSTTADCFLSFKKLKVCACRKKHVSDRESEKEEEDSLRRTCKKPPRIDSSHLTLQRLYNLSRNRGRMAHRHVKAAHLVREVKAPGCHFIRVLADCTMAFGYVCGHSFGYELDGINSRLVARCGFMTIQRARMQGQKRTDGLVRCRFSKG